MDIKNNILFLFSYSISDERNMWVLSIFSIDIDAECTQAIFSIFLFKSGKWKILWSCTLLSVPAAAVIHIRLRNDLNSLVPAQTAILWMTWKYKFSKRCREIETKKPFYNSDLTYACFSIPVQITPSRSSNSYWILS